MADKQEKVERKVELIVGDYSRLGVVSFHLPGAGGREGREVGRVEWDGSGIHFKFKDGLEPAVRAEVERLAAAYAPKP